jgi:hypothetical protein
VGEIMRESGREGRGRKEEGGIEKERKGRN